VAAETESTEDARVGRRRAAVVAARDEADRIGDTVRALRTAMPGIEVWVADDASADGTRDAAMAAGATVVGRNRPHGKGGNMTAAATAALDDLPDDATVLLCDGDLGASAANLVPLVEAVEAGDCDLAIAGFARKVGGGLGLAKGYARWAIERLSGYEATAPISGQRAMSAATLRLLLPFAPRYGMEIGMTVDAVRAGRRVAEIDLPLEHRATGKTLGGFLHRGRQLRDFIGVHASRRRG
jgi:glycosyltransferase involved in cell wall biosynthesis